MLKTYSGKEEIHMGFCNLGGFIIPLSPNIVVLKTAVYTGC